MRLSFILFAFLLWSAGLMAQPAALITEWSHGPATQQEWVEILVLEDNLDMTGWKLRDGNSELLFFGPDFSSLPKGTLILVYNYGLEQGGGARDPRLDEVNWTGGLDRCLSLFTPNAQSFPTIGWSNQNAFGNSNMPDNPMLLDASDNIVHDWDNNDDPGFVNAALRPGARQAVRFIGTDASQIADPASWERYNWDDENITPGRANTPQVKEWIDGMIETTCAYFVSGSELTFQAETTDLQVNIPVGLVRPVKNDVSSVIIRILPSSTAERGVDYRLLSGPSDMEIQLSQDGSETFYLDFTVLATAVIQEPSETVELELIETSSVGVVVGQERLTIYLLPPAQTDNYAAYSSESLVCEGKTVDLFVLTSGGETPPPGATVRWEPAGQVENADAPNTRTLPLTETTTFTVTIENGQKVETHEVVIEVAPNRLRIAGVFQQPQPRDGAAYLLMVPINGTKPYQYSIDGGVSFQDGALFRGLSAGTFELKVRDAAGCELDKTFELR